MTDELDDYAHAIDDVTAAATRTRDPIDPDSLPDPTPSSLRAVPSPNPDYLEPWTRQPDEQDKAWEKFEWYRNLGPIRTLRQVAAHFDNTLGYIEKLSLKYDWVSRASAFDHHEDQLYQLRRQQAIRDMADRHSEQLINALEALQLPYQALLRKLEAEPDLIDKLADRNVKQLLQMATSAARVVPGMMAAERVVRGMPSERVEVTGQVTHVHTPDRSAIDEIVATLQRAGAFDGRNDPSAALGAGEIVEGEVVEVRPGGEEWPAPETDGVPSP